MLLRPHRIVLQGEFVSLRPLTEEDWELLLAWNSNPDLLYFTEGDDVSAYDLETVQLIYRTVSQKAFCFMIELNGQPIGEGWLQELNLERIQAQHPSKDCRRIDLMIGEKQLWGGGLGTDTIRTLTRFGFESERADLIFGLVSDYNERSRRAFQRVGYEIDAEIPEPPGMKAKFTYDLVISQTKWNAISPTYALDG
jgi:RimJ/RimL family protein N-acetyltransferase